MVKMRCPRCGSRWHTDCYDPDSPMPFNGRLFILAVVVSWVIVGCILFGIRAAFACGDMPPPDMTIEQIKTITI